jgi:hypothetical protein
MMRVLMDEVVETDYGQLDLWVDGDGGDAEDEDEGDVQATFADQVNGLAGAATPGRIYLNLARRSGGSPVRIEAHDEEAPLGQDWEDIVEVSTVVGQEGRGGWTSWAGEDGGELELPSGPCRVRVSARGRDAGADGEDADEPVDFYLVQLWPAPVEPDVIVRVGSDDARSWHREWGSQR